MPSKLCFSPLGAQKNGGGRPQAVALLLVVLFTAVAGTAVAQSDIRPAGSLAVQWGQIKVLDLATAVKIALADNPTLAAAAARVRQAREQVNEAKAAYWPRVGVDLGVSRIELSETGFGQSAPGGILVPLEDPEDYYNADLKASWVLFDGFARKFRKLAARYGLDTSLAGQKEAHRLLLSSVAATYFSAQLAQQNIVIARADEQFNQRQLADAQSRYQAGTGSLSDVLNFKIRLNAARANRIVAQAQLDITLIGLAALLGRPDSRLPAHVKLAPMEEPLHDEFTRPDADALAEAALSVRPDVIQRKMEIKNAAAQVKIARSEYMPRVVVAGSLDGKRTDGPAFTEDDFGNSISVNLTYDLFTGGARSARLRRAKAALQEAFHQLEQTRLTVKSEVKQAAATLRSAQEKLALEKANLEMVRRQRELVEKGYQAGQESLVRLNEAQKELVAAQGRLAVATAAVHKAWYALLAATGQILAYFDR